MNIPANLLYTKEHEWALLEGETATLGITDYAQDALGDIVFLELPNVGDTFTAGQTIGVVESVKAVSDIYTPLSGEVIDANKELVKTPERLNSDPYGAAWLIKIKPSNPAEAKNLMSAEAYQKYLAEEKE